MAIGCVLLALVVVVVVEVWKGREECRVSLAGDFEWLREAATAAAVAVAMGGLMLVAAVGCELGGLSEAAGGHWGDGGWMMREDLH